MALRGMRVRRDRAYVREAPCSNWECGYFEHLGDLSRKGCNRAGDASQGVWREAVKSFLHQLGVRIL